MCLAGLCVSICINLIIHSVEYPQHETAHCMAVLYDHWCDLFLYCWSRSHAQTSIVAYNILKFCITKVHVDIYTLYMHMYVGWKNQSFYWVH